MILYHNNGQVLTDISIDYLSFKLDNAIVSGLKLRQNQFDSYDCDVFSIYKNVGNMLKCKRPSKTYTEKVIPMININETLKEIQELIDKNWISNNTNTLLFNLNLFNYNLGTYGCVEILLTNDQAGYFDKKLSIVTGLFHGRFPPSVRS